MSRFACGMWHGYSYHAGVTGYYTDPGHGLPFAEWCKRRDDQNRAQWFAHVARLDAAIQRMTVTDDDRQRALATKWRLLAERRKRAHDGRFVDAVEAMLRGEL